MCISGAPASGANFHVRFYPDVRLTAQIYKKFLSGSPADGSQRVKRHTDMHRNCQAPGYRLILQIFLKMIFRKHNVSNHLGVSQSKIVCQYRDFDLCCVICSSQNPDLCLAPVCCTN